MYINNATILRELERRAQAHQNGALVFFHDAGVPLESEEQIMLSDLKNLVELQPEYFEKLVQFLYPEKFETANAGGFDWANNWTSVLGGALTGIGGAMLSGGNNDAAIADAQYQAQMAELKAAQQKKTLIIILCVFAVLIVAGVIVFKSKK